MALVTLKEALSQSVANKYAVGAFVTPSFSVTQAILEAAEETGDVPVILMLPWGIVADMESQKRDVYLRCTMELVRSSSAPICVHLDHGGSYSEVINALHAGFSGVMLDASSKPMEENIALTKQVVETAHWCGVSVEGEIGHVGGAEAGALIEGGLSADNRFFTTADEAVHFIEKTNVDCLAVSFGTVHGIYKGTPKLDLDRLDEIRAAVQVPLVMHGGSGLPEDAFRAAVAHGVNKINFFTGLSMGAAAAVRAVCKEKGDKPMHIMEIEGAQFASVKETVKHHISLFGTKPLK